MGQWGVIAIALVSLALVVLQNDTVIVPLVVLGRSLPALPLGWWMAGAIVLGWLTMSWLLLLARVGRAGRSRRPEPWQRREDPPAPVPPRRVARALDDEPPDTETNAAPPPTERSPQRGWQDAPEDLADPATEFEQVVGDWDEPNRQDAGWRDDAAWDEWQMPAPPRRPRRDQRSPAMGDAAGVPVDAQLDSRPDSRPDSRSEPPSELQWEPSLRDRSGSSPNSEPKTFEVPQTPIKQSQVGSIYSYRYREDDDLEDDLDDSPVAAASVNDSPTASNRPAAGPDRDAATAPRVILVPGASGETPLDRVLDADRAADRAADLDADRDADLNANFDSDRAANRDPDADLDPDRDADSASATVDPAANREPAPTVGPARDRPSPPPDRPPAPAAPVPLDLSPAAPSALPINLPAPPPSDRPPLHLSTPPARPQTRPEARPEARPPLTLGDRPGAVPGSDSAATDEWDDLGDLAEASESNLGGEDDAAVDWSGSLRSQLRRDRRATSRPESPGDVGEAGEASQPDRLGQVRSWFQRSQRHSPRDRDNRWAQTQDSQDRTGDDWDDWAANPRPTPSEWEEDR